MTGLRQGDVRRRLPRGMFVREVPTFLVVHPRVLERLREHEAHMRRLVRPEVIDAIDDAEVETFVLGRRKP